jgi:hypothetical protein
MSLGVYQDSCLRAGKHPFTWIVADPEDSTVAEA